mmetsp:Transcript_1093/g.3329  ORF Transcript_1093/g.3329 Transcript_1093/m.3329 type:complete len:229 (-) Transcript_1093:1695-2381(-)
MSCRSARQPCSGIRSKLLNSRRKLRSSRRWWTGWRQRLVRKRPGLQQKQKCFSSRGLKPRPKKEMPTRSWRQLMQCWRPGGKRRWPSRIVPPNSRRRRRGCRQPQSSCGRSSALQRRTSSAPTCRAAATLLTRLLACINWTISCRRRSSSCVRLRRHWLAAPRPPMQPHSRMREPRQWTIWHSRQVLGETHRRPRGQAAAGRGLQRRCPRRRRRGCSTPPRRPCAHLL